MQAHEQLETLTAPEIAERLSLSLDAVYDYAQAGVLPKLNLPSAAIRFDWRQVKVTLSRLTIWEHCRTSHIEVSDEIVTRAQLAAILGVTIAHVGLLGRRRLIPRIRLGATCIRYDAAAVRESLASFVTAKEVAKRLRLSVDAVRRMSGKRLPVLRINRRFVRYHWPTVSAAIAKA